MKRQWKTGTVALLGLGMGGEIPTLAMRMSGGCWNTGEEIVQDSWPHWVRPLVVIDPENREQVERLLRSFLTNYDGAESIPSKGEIDSMQAALREFADPKPSKPEEPTGFAAVVVDTTGRRWLRDGMLNDGGPWFHGPAPRGEGWERRTWDQIDVAEILTDGVPALGRTSVDAQGKHRYTYGGTL